MWCVETVVELEISDLVGLVTSILGLLERKKERFSCKTEEPYEIGEEEKAELAPPNLNFKSIARCAIDRRPKRST